MSDITITEKRKMRFIDVAKSHGTRLKENNSKSWDLQIEIMLEIYY